MRSALAGPFVKRSGLPFPVDATFRTDTTSRVLPWLETGTHLRWLSLVVIVAAAGLSPHRLPPRRCRGDRALGDMARRLPALDIASHEGEVSHHSLWAKETEMVAAALGLWDIRG
jgi:hypothetical protein